MQDELTRFFPRDRFPDHQKVATYWVALALTCASLFVCYSGTNASARKLGAYFQGSEYFSMTLCETLAQCSPVRGQYDDLSLVLQRTIDNWPMLYGQILLHQSRPCTDHIFR